jgi:hypothetical protein
MILSVKHLAIFMQCSQKTAQRRAKEIRDLYGVKHITIYHLADYLGLTPKHLASYWVYEASKPNGEMIEFPQLKTKEDKSGQEQ